MAKIGHGFIFCLSYLSSFNFLPLFLFLITLILHLAPISYGLKKHLLLSFAFLISSQLFCQLQFGFRAGATISRITDRNLAGSSINFSNDYYSGINFGFFSDLELSEKTRLELGLDITQRGFKETSSFESDSLAYIQEVEMNFFYLRIPLSLKYNFTVGKLNFCAKSGLYLGIGTGGRYEANPNIYRNRTGIDYLNEPYERGVIFVSSLHSQNLANAFYGSDYYLNRLDYGATFGLGYRYKNLLLEAGYDLGLQNLVPPSAVPIYDPNLRYYNRSFLITAGIYF